jgi:metal-responsive CopG/Arc/MetJ family transcriptional regulator
MTILKRTQMYFPEDLLNEIKRKAKREKTTVSEIVREASLDFIKQDRTKDWANDPLWDMVGSSESNEEDLSIRHDDYLYGKKK